MSREERNKIEYAVICVDEYAAYHNIKPNEAGRYLSKYGGIDYLDEFYDIEHTLPIADTIETLTNICAKNGSAK